MSEFAVFLHPLPSVVRVVQRYDGKLSPGLKALGELPLAAWVQILGAIAIVELTVGKQDYENKVCTCMPRGTLLPLYCWCC